jgi:cyclohexa-1,5-dienecarbonyl-CoA hydratase
MTAEVGVRESPLAVEIRDQVWLLRLQRPKANVIDGAMVAALRAAFAEAGRTPALKAIVLTSAGQHFSFGASVQEHLPQSVTAMLHGFHDLFRAIAAASVPVLAAVRGQCLGGGLELVAFCNRVFAAADARLGQPEIALGVFAPVASLLLPHRMGQGAAEDLCLSGRTIDAEEALRLGLVDVIAEDPEAAALAYAREHLCRHSASSLRHAVRALRAGFLRRFLHDLEQVEGDYLQELMATQDAVEGIRAFLEKRAPQWRNA